MPVPSSQFSALHVLALLVIGFAGWVAYDAVRPPRLPQPPAQGSPPPFDLVGVTKRFSALRPGLSRPEVDGYLREFTGSGKVGPVELSAGGATYTVRHHVQLITPLPSGEHPQGFSPGPHIVSLVFDARESGHPLLRIVAVPTGPPPVAGGEVSVD